MMSYKTETAPEMSNEDETLNYTDVIETVISSLDQHNKVLVNASEDGYIWKFQYGSVDVYIQLTGISEDDTFTVWSPVLQLPVQNETHLMRKLLELNWLSTFEAHFSMFNQQVVAVTSRSVADLSPGEISHLITLVATIADDHDEELQAEFPAVTA
ncbi:YbjN domain-containing protein [Acaryochloris sp. IP29b_bin.148]|uniref:YbjN domain-containing protein n=1 Tax=Acaryochloris sp. IP29b_bin.148 TaxID=2969218 RepID=UPI002639570A|nr:YbjN domain-containing protein [Acaryochloris sp. IP29b_bin.148]